MKRLHLKDAIYDDEAFYHKWIATWRYYCMKQFDEQMREAADHICVAPYSCPDVQRAEGEGMPTI